jgi:D-threo-aldose 1-dehydrogenase
VFKYGYMTALAAQCVDVPTKADNARMSSVGTTGVLIPSLGFGGAPLGNLYSAVSDVDARAPYYGAGLSEARLGAFVAGLERDDIIVSTKVGRVLVAGSQDASSGFVDTPDAHTVFDYSRQGVATAIAGSMDRLATDRIDIVFVHDVGRLTHGDKHVDVLTQVVEETLPALAELKAAGRIGAIGIGVNETAVCMDVLQRADLDCILLAGRYTLLEQTPIADLLPLCEQRNISVIVGGPFNSGILADRRGPGSTYDYGEANALVVERARRLYEVCERFGVDTGAAAAQFPLGHSAVASVIAGLRSASEVEQFVARMAEPLPRELWIALRHQGLIADEALCPA